MAIGRTNCVVGGGKLFAAISVAYPQGSVLTCTCTETGELLTAEDESGLWLFAIPYVGTWIVSATDGEQTASETVEISKEWQSVSIELDYTLWLFDGDNGGDVTKNTGGWTSSGTSYAKAEATDIDIYTIKNSSSGFSINIRTTNKVDLSGIKTLYLKRTRSSGWGGSTCDYGIPALQVWDGSNAVASVYLGKDTASTTISLDVSSVTGEYYIRFALNNPKNISQWTRTEITHLWGE